MKKIVSTLVLATFAIFVFAAAPVTQSAENFDNTTSKVVVNYDKGDLDKDPTVDGDKKKKSDSKRSSCKSSAKSCCSSQSSTSGTASAKSCCSSKKEACSSKCKDKTE